VNQPQIADVAIAFGLRVMYKRAIEPHEKERRSDPCDRCGDMEPPPQEQQPFKELLIHPKNVPVFHLGRRCFLGMRRAIL
jgi:hypothetical protein